MSRVRYEDLDRELIDQLALEAADEVERKRYHDLEAALRRDAARLRWGDFVVLSMVLAACAGAWWAIYKGLVVTLQWLATVIHG